ncbi:MAG: GHKL domain-containing protein [Lachnospiraceae bacterium]|nr:GHKL domain-containing protein [Lachnospiraceae bacterium]MDE7272884.1 GHKL domain-containing protein [Lachnospiraceae bacterium]
MPGYVSRRISRFQNELVNRHYDEVDTMYRKMRGWRHDYHNHIQTLMAYLSMAQYDEASGYLEQLTEDLAKVDTVLRTGNVKVDAILNSKLALIQERNINVDATAIVPKEISVPDIDLSVLIGNLMDNAMEACAKLPEEERFIRVYIDVIKKQLYISVTNSMNGKAKRRGNHFLSDKQGNHGFGLLRIDDIVARHGGYLNRKAEDGVFATEVMLPLVREVP